VLSFGQAPAFFVRVQNGIIGNLHNTAHNMLRAIVKVYKSDGVNL